MYRQKIVKSNRSIFKNILALLLSSVIAGFFTVNAYADTNTSGFSMSPMYEKISLAPGETYTGSFKIRTPDTAVNPFYYKIYNQPYYRNNNNEAIFEEVSGRSQIVNWTTIDVPETGFINPGERKVVEFTIRVPENAPVGGQYMTITVGSDTEAENSGSMIQESVAIGYTVYAEITGDVIRDGEILDIDVPSFLLTDKISGSSTIKNTGNVHSNATYTLQVSPLFSDKEIYTNANEPDSHLIMPDRTLYSQTTWEDTPIVGIFNVTYTAEFENHGEEINRIVVICPIWLLFTIIFVIVILIVWIFLHIIHRKKQKNLAKKSC